MPRRGRMHSITRACGCSGAHTELADRRRHRPARRVGAAVLLALGWAVENVAAWALLDAARRPSPRLLSSGAAACCAAAPYRGLVALPDLIGRARLHDELSRRGIDSKELPCMAFERTGAPLATALAERDWQCIIVTAPESASVLLDAWGEVGRKSLNVACVGQETRQMLRAAGLQPLDYESATGKELAAALPAARGDAAALPVLLPVSVKATQELQRALEARGFAVVRMDTYDSVSVQWSSDQHSLASGAEVVALASPSAIRTWAERVGTETKVACFGKKSEATCQSLGFTNLFVSTGGMEGWADAVQSALRSS